MNKAAEKIATILGSAYVIGGFGLWVIVHAFLSQDYVTTISDLAIEIGFLILRAETVQGQRVERSIKQAEADTKADLEQTTEIRQTLDKLLKKRYPKT